ncbi:MAG: AmmeMemoRadiSam system protein B [Planctomycetes bacterium]|nr:AmmeMemoRadiSam system protein B [Planctomycetota bacterium]
MLETFPRLRAEIDAAPASRDGEMYYILYDRAGIAPSRLLVSPLGLLAAGRLDGASSLLEVADRISREVGGGGVQCAEIEKVVAALDEALFLEGPRYHDYLSQAVRDFAVAPVRPAGSAGSAYEDDPIELAKQLDAMLAEAPEPEQQVRTMTRPRGIISPHIDYLRGAPGYGQVYTLLNALPAPETVVVIGTAHMPLSSRFSLCDKDFATPLGTVRLDRDRAAQLADAIGEPENMAADLLVHRSEHSIELQAVWLRHIYGPEVKIVPVLAGSLGEYLEGGEDPKAAADEAAIKGLATVLGEFAASGDVLIMASADLSHVGPRFGDNEEITNQFLGEVEAVDRDYLADAGRSAVAGLANLARHGDRHHVCGSACIFALGLAVPDAEARLLGYHQAASPEMGQAVTYAAMALL